MYDKRYNQRRNFRVNEDMLRRVTENRSIMSKREGCEFCERDNEENGCMIYGEMPNSLAMVCSPVQSFCDVYDEEKGFRRGTIFSQLDKPFLGGKSVKTRGGNNNGCK